MADQIIVEEKRPPEKTSNGNRFGMLFFVLMIVVVIGLAGYGYSQLLKMHQSLTEMISQLQTQTTNHQQEITDLHQSVNNLQQAAQKSQEFSAQQEQLIAEWRSAQKGDLDKWRVAEAQYLVRLANDHVQFINNVALAISMLQRADQALQNLQDPALLEIRKSITSDIANLQAGPQIDVPDLYLRLTTLNNQLDQLPLPLNPLKSENKPKPSVTAQPNLSWWRAGLDYTWNALSKVVVVRYNSANALPLVMPEEKAFLYQNLHAQIEGALWGLLHRNNNVYQASLTRATAWIKRYFDQDANETKTALKSLEELQKINVEPTAVTLSATLQLFDNYFSKAGQTIPAQ